MVLNNHLYTLYYNNKREQILLKIFKNYDDNDENTTNNTTGINRNNKNSDNDYQDICNKSNLFLRLLPENNYLLIKLIKGIKNDNLNFIYMSFKILEIYFNNNELSIKNLPPLLELLVESIIFIEIIIYLHILILNIHHYNENIINNFINISEINKIDKGNNYLLLMNIIINTCNTYKSLILNNDLINNPDYKEIHKYFSENINDITNIINVNLDSATVDLMNLIDNNDSTTQNRDNTNQNQNTDDMKKITNKILITYVSSIFENFNNSIVDLIKIFNNILAKEDIIIPNDENKNIFVLIATVFNYNKLKLLN